VIDMYIAYICQGPCFVHSDPQLKLMTGGFLLVYPPMVCKPEGYSIVKMKQGCQNCSSRVRNELKKLLKYFTAAYCLEAIHRIRDVLSSNLSWETHFTI